MHQHIYVNSDTHIYVQYVCVYTHTNACTHTFTYIRTTRGSLVEITNQRFSVNYQTFWQLVAAFISGSGLQSVHVLKP